jgi:flagellar biosynthesis/type III secretory pathway M-ring protein FliF/YscJ
VTSAEFSKLDEPPPPPSLYEQVPQLHYWPYAVAGILAFGTLVSLIRLVSSRRAAKRRAKEAAAHAAQAEAVAAAEEAATQQLEGEQQDRLLEGDAAEAFRAAALELASKDPATAAVVLRKWLSAAAEQQAA